MHPLATVIAHTYLADLRGEADAQRLLASLAADRRGHAAPDRLRALRRALETVSRRIGPRPLDLPAGG